MKPVVLVCAAMLAFALPVRADDTIQKLFSATDVAQRSALLRQLEQTEDRPQSAYALGAIRFFLALERFARDLHDHGFRSPQTMLLPLMRLPVPANPDPRPITYQKWRAMLAGLEDGLDRAGKTLAAVPADAAIAIDVDLTQLRIDLNGDGALSEDESLAAVMQAMSAPNRARRRGQTDDQPQSPTFRFDRADGYWLEGYAHFLMANTAFWLAHDFETSFDTGFQLFFPNTRFPIDDYAGAPSEAQRRQAPAPRGGFLEKGVFDFVSLIHTVNWEVTAPDRRRAVRGHLKQMIRLSRENWRAIMRETDNEREWLPGPHQPGIHPLTGLEVDRETAAGWQNALDLFENVLDGAALIPHPRFEGVGINLSRFFDEPKRFDLVLSMTGPAVLPYLEPGNVLSARDWRSVTRQFAGRNFWTFAVWFN